VQNKQLIESGILESHLLGIASDTEKIEVQRHLKESQEILEYVYELDKDLQSFFNVQSVPPPPNLRVELEARIGRSELQKNHVSGESDRTVVLQKKIVKKITWRLKLVIPIYGYTSYGVQRSCLSLYYRRYS
jgi:hypothetical protein